MKVNNNKKFLPRVSCLGMVLTAVTMSAEVFSHAHLGFDSLTPPRSNNRGLYDAPCGGKDRGDSPVTLTAGTQIDVGIKIEARHRGVFRIAFSPANDQGFENNILVDNFPEPRDTRDFNIPVTVPNQPCEECTLQMTYIYGNDPRDYFYSCSDIRIVSQEVNTAPVAKFTASVVEGMAPLSVSFDASTSTDSTGAIASYDWKFGSPDATATGVNAQYEFLNPGTYEASLTVTDDGGLAATETVTINVMDPEVIQPILTADISSGVTPLTVKFEGGLSSDSKTVTDFVWMFNGQMITSLTGQADPNFTFTEPGTYKIVLNMIDSDGNEYAKEVTIQAQYNPDQMSALEFATILLDDWNTLDTFNEQTLSFEQLKESGVFNTVPDDVLSKVDTNSNSILEKSEVQAFKDGFTIDTPQEPETPSVPETPSTPETPDSVDQPSTNASPDQPAAQAESDDSGGGGSAQYLIPLLLLVFCRRRKTL